MPKQKSTKQPRQYKTSQSRRETDGAEKEYAAAATASTKGRRNVGHALLFRNCTRLDVQDWHIRVRLTMHQEELNQSAGSVTGT